jgi:TatD DNase family protein
MICATSNPSDIIPAIQIAESHNNIFVTIGVHPEYVGIDARAHITKNVLTHPRVVGIGEIGLDYHERNDKRTEQIKLFESQLEIAREYSMPVAIHTRDAESDTASILTGVRGVMHCFTSSYDLARTMLDRGFFFSASGILTFKNADAVRETFAKIPVDRIVIETDSPFCAPVPHRGKTCEPFMVVETARVLAKIKHLQIEELETILERNTIELYPKIKQ